MKLVESIMVVVMTGRTTIKLTFLVTLVAGTNSKPLAFWLQEKHYHSPRAITYRNTLEYLDWRTSYKKKTGKTNPSQVMMAITPLSLYPP